MSLKKVPYIEMAKCTKCRKCIAVCPHQAIVARKNSDDFYSCTKCVKYCLHFDNVTCKPENICIVFDKCDSCGACFEACEFGAISWVSADG